MFGLNIQREERQESETHVLSSLNIKRAGKLNVIASLKWNLPLLLKVLYIYCSYSNVIGWITCQSNIDEVLLQKPFFEMMLTKDCREDLETDGCFIRLLARKIYPSLYRANDYIYQRHDFGDEVYFFIIWLLSLHSL